MAEKKTKGVLTLIEKIGKIQEAIGKLSKDKKNPFYNSKYADLNQVLDVLGPELEKHNIVLTQPVSYVVNAIDGHLEPIITTTLTETTDGKEVMTEPFPLPLNLRPQKMGSAITYFRRYCLKTLFKMQDEDDDGNDTTEKPRTVSPAKKANKKAPTADSFNFD